MRSKLPMYLGDKVTSVLATGEEIIAEFKVNDPDQKKNVVPNGEYGSGITVTNRRTIISKVKSRQMFTPGTLKQLDKIYAGKLHHPRVFLDEYSYFHDQVESVVVNRGLAPTIQIFRRGELFKPVVMTMWNVGHAQEIENACMFDSIDNALRFQGIIENLVNLSKSETNPAKPASFVDQLVQLDQLRKNGILTDAEFEEAKRRVMAGK